MTKKELKTSEARILIYLSQAEPQTRYLMAISFKLEIEYNYLARIMRGLQIKELVQQGNSMIKNKKFYDLTEHGLSKLDTARRRLSADGLEALTGEEHEVAQ